MFSFTQQIKEVIAKLYFFIMRNKISDKQLQVRNFADVRNLCAVIVSQLFYFSE